MAVEALTQSVDRSHRSYMVDVGQRPTHMTVTATQFLRFLLVASLLTPFPLMAQADGTYDPTFVQGDGFVGTVHTMARQPDGRILVGGDELTTYDGVEVPLVVRLHADGSLDPSFDAGQEGSGRVQSIALQADGRILVGGTFSQFDGVPSSGLVRLMPDGSIDTGFGIGTGPDDDVTCIVVQPDGRILVAGFFDTFNGTSAGRIVRLMPNGTIDPSFTAGTGANEEVNEIVVRQDGRILLGGYFTTFNGIPRRKIVQLAGDGTVDIGFDPGNGAGTDYTVWAIAETSDGKVLCGGSFFSWGGTTVDGLVRLNADGTRDVGFDANANASTIITKIITQPDGNVLIAGMLGLDRVTSTGADDPAYDQGIGFFGGMQIVRDALLLPDGRILAAGDFDDYDGNPVGGIVRITSADVGVEEAQQDALRLWPNPSSGSVRIALEGSDGPLRIRVLDATGRQVGGQQWISEEGEVLLPSTPGAYVVEIQRSSGRWMRASVIRE